MSRVLLYDLCDIMCIENGRVIGWLIGYRINIRKLMETGDCEPQGRRAKWKNLTMPVDDSNTMRIYKRMTAKNVESEQKTLHRSEQSTAS